MEYTFVERNDMDGTGEHKMIPTPVHCSQISYKDFLKECANMGFREAEIDGVLKCVADRLMMFMEIGHSVKLNPLGTFRPKLGMKKGHPTLTADDMQERHNTEHVEIKSLNFIASQDFIKDFKHKTELEYCGKDKNLRRITTSREERLQMALDFLDSHQEMRVIDYLRITGMAKTSACKELREFCADPESGLTKIGNANQLRYVKREQND